MTGQIPFVELTREGLREAAKEAASLAQAQTSVRGEVIRTINTLVDTLQLAADVVGKEISATIAEHNDGRRGQRGGFLSRAAARFSHDGLWVLLHEGRVCGPLHELGDRFANPLSKEVWSGISAWEAVMTFFRRTSPMSQALQRLREGEGAYLHELAQFLDDARNFAEQHRHDQGDQAEQSCEELVSRLRDKRSALLSAIWSLRSAADECIAKLH